MNDNFENNLQRQLRNSEDGLDAPTAARLHAARNRAVASANSSGNNFWNNNQWLRIGVPATATACAILAAIFVALLPGSQSGQQPDELTVVDASDTDAPMDEQSLLDFETSLLLAAEADEFIKLSTDEQNINPEGTQELLDLYENLEFYEWLALEELEESA